MGYFVDDIAERLSLHQEGDGWQMRLISFIIPSPIIIIIISQDIEASLHCIMSIQEAVDMENVAHLDRLFSPAILGRLPSTGRSRVRRTALGVIGGSSFQFQRVYSSNKT